MLMGEAIVEFNPSQGDDDISLSSYLAKGNSSGSTFISATKSPLFALNYALVPSKDPRCNWAWQIML